MSLVDVFWNPQLVATYGIDIWIKGASSHDQYETDNKINSVLRNFLFVSPNDPVRFGIDLGSLNIQRGRDHGLPDYNTACAFYTGVPARKFSDITSTDSLARELKGLYGDVNNIDLWVGILAEDHLPNKSVGRTLNAMLKSQFEKLRDGDFYFYLNDPFLPQNIRNEIRNSKFSDVIKRNTSLSNILTNAFITDSCHFEEAAAARKATTPTTTAQENILNIRVFPNPANNVLNVDMPAVEEKTTINIYSSTGELLKSNTVNAARSRTQISIRDLPQGVYMVRIITRKKSQTVSFTKF